MIHEESYQRLGRVARMGDCQMHTVVIFTACVIGDKIIRTKKINTA